MRRLAISALSAAVSLVAGDAWPDACRVLADAPAIPEVLAERPEAGRSLLGELVARRRARVREADAVELEVVERVDAGDLALLQDFLMREDTAREGLAARLLLADACMGQHSETAREVAGAAWAELAEHAPDGWEGSLAAMRLVTIEAAFRSSDADERRAGLARLADRLERLFRNMDPVDRDEPFARDFRELTLGRPDASYQALLALDRGAVARQLGRASQARQIYMDVVMRWPGTVYADKALRRLRTMDRMGE